ncbi:hypothetical protein F7725_017911 [Dissostichus mawsoni]|uniref:F5/8 type C domain-containing protein n=1 Tax=Dissostichus mawsoni TaxID=36200 RepID=A0A7J5XQ19_DISMA|nr:hypothetical protein F7725_017911 [Dissostichus mawsoni]
MHSHKKQHQPLVAMDLRRTHKVFTVKVTNRDEDPERLNGAEIRIGDSLETLATTTPGCIQGAPIQTQQRATLVTKRGVARKSDPVKPFRARLDLPAALLMETGNKFHSGSCSHTDAESNPWWRVDLLEPYIVTSVIISNRADCCSERLVGAQVHIGNSLDNNGATNPVVGTITTAGALHTMTFTDRVEGRYVTVRIPDENLAIQGKAAQSSVYGSADADRAIDGNPSPRWGDGSCSHTSNELNPWWRLALPKTHKVFSVKITNRNEFHKRINGAEISIGDSFVNNGADNPRFGVITSIPAGQTAEFKVPDGMDGRYVYIGIPGRKEYLTLCEVEVFGSALD